VHRFVETADAVGATTKKLEKVRLMSELFKSLSVAEAVLAARFFSAHAFPGYDERTLGVGGALLWRVIGEAAGKEGESLGTVYRKHGDMGDMAEELLRASNRDRDLPILEMTMLADESCVTEADARALGQVALVDAAHAASAAPR